MTTDQTSISICVTQDLLEKLQTYQTQHNISTTADAATAVLIQFFESGTTQSKTASMSIQSAPYPGGIVQPDIDDDIEDEPDEILWDFLPDEDQ